MKIKNSETLNTESHISGHSAPKASTSIQDAITGCLQIVYLLPDQLRALEAPLVARRPQAFFVQTSLQRLCHACDPTLCIQMRYPRYLPIV
jgi:hypothetical protein